MKISVLILIVFLPGCGKNTQSNLPVKDNMVLIPAGTYQIGKGGDHDYSPERQVILNSFYIDIYEVTNAQYAEFCEATERKLPVFWGIDKFHCGPDFPNHPIVGVSWYDAEAYAEWQGKRLPTEAEWEAAGRGGLSDMNYPNGNDIDTTLANITQKGQRRGTKPVGSYEANNFGIFDMAGNVLEWVSDYYSEGYTLDELENPTGPDSGKFKVIRGGGWHSGPGCNKVYYRNALPSNWSDFAVGFRCVKDVR